MKNIIISDPTLRDGNHAVKHQLTAEQISQYTKAANDAGVDIVEVGHGCGLGGSSLQFGYGLLSDQDMLRIARRNLTQSKLGIHIIPGIGRQQDLDIAYEEGVDVFRVGAHCTEANITKNFIKNILDHKKTAFGVLMMTHMADAEKLVEEAKKMADYGAQAIIMMDSAGAALPMDVSKKISALHNATPLPIGFHAHNNLGLSIANSLFAAEAGATIIDGTARGFGAGSGNTPIELLVAVLQKSGYVLNIDLHKILEAVEIAEKYIPTIYPKISTQTIVSGLTGVFSGFSKMIEALSKKFNVDQKQIYFELGKRRLVAGQEDVILEVVNNILNQQQQQGKLI